MAGQPIIDQRTGISVAVALTLGSGLFLAGNYMGKIDNLERMDIPKELASIRADLGIIKNRLGIPAASHAVYGPTSAGTAAISLPLWLPPQSPLIAAKETE